MEIWAISLDDLTDEIFNFLGTSDIVGSHYFGYEGERDHVRQMMLNRMGMLLDRLMYPATKYGSPIEEEVENGDN